MKHVSARVANAASTRPYRLTLVTVARFVETLDLTTKEIAEEVLKAEVDRLTKEIDLIAVDEVSVSNGYTIKQIAPIPDCEDVEKGNEPTVFTTMEVARLFGVSKQTIRNWRQNGKLPYIQSAGGCYLFEKSAVEKILREKECAR